MKEEQIIKRENQIMEEINAINDKIEMEGRIITAEESKRIGELAREFQKLMEELRKNPFVV